MDRCLVVQLMFIAAIIGIKEVSSDVCDNKSHETCCYNYYFDASLQQCVECPLGRYGQHCKLKCMGGYYGHLCQTKCDCEASSCDPVTGCNKQSVVENGVSNNTTEYNTMSLYQGMTENTSLVSDNTRLVSVQTMKNSVLKNHHNNQIWMLVSFFLVGSVGTSLIVAIFIYRRKLGGCKSSTNYPYLGSESATAGHTTEVELDEQPMWAMCAANDDSDVYDEIRNSLLYNCSNSRADARLSPCSGKGESTSKREPQMSENLYSGYNDEGDYSYLQLKKRRSSGFKMKWSNEKCNKQEEYVTLKSSDTMVKRTQNGKGRCKILDRISETDFNLPIPDRKFTYSLVGCTSENNFGESNKGAVHAAPETSEESPMNSTCFKAKTNQEERPYSLVNLRKINDDL